MRCPFGKPGKLQRAIPRADLGIVDRRSVLVTATNEMAGELLTHHLWINIFRPITKVFGEARRTKALPHSIGFGTYFQLRKVADPVPQAYKAGRKSRNPRRKFS